jgi:hypothetical protein
MALIAGAAALVSENASECVSEDVSVDDSSGWFGMGVCGSILLV